MDNLTPEMALMDPEERAEVEFIWNLIPAEDRGNMTPDDVLFVLDKMDDYLEEKGLVEYDELTGEATYADGEIDEEIQVGIGIDFYSVHTCESRADCKADFRHQSSCAFKGQIIIKGFFYITDQFIQITCALGLLESQLEFAVAVTIRNYDGQINIRIDGCGSLSSIGRGFNCYGSVQSQLCAVGDSFLIRSVEDKTYVLEFCAYIAFAVLFKKLFINLIIFRF